MAQLAVERLGAAQLVLDLAAMAASIVAGLEILIRVVDFVGRAFLPLVDA